LAEAVERKREKTVPAAGAVIAACKKRRREQDCDNFASKIIHGTSMNIRLKMSIHFDHRMNSSDFNANY
jgi:hypothetical protein